MKFIGKATAFAAALILALSAAGCGDKEGNVTEKGLILKSVKEGDGYVVRVGKDETAYTASIGVRFDKNEFRADDPVYASYESVEERENGLLAKGKISSEWGTSIAFTDAYTVVDGEVYVDRQFTVETAGEDYAFMTELRFTDEKEGNIMESDWFIPASYYVTGEHTFGDSSTRMFFDRGELLSIPADDVSLLMASRYQDGSYFALTDLTPGYREDIVENDDATTTLMHIDANQNIPGIVLAMNEGHVSVSEVYPSFVHRSQDNYIWRMLPVEEGFTRSVSMVLKFGEAESYPEMLRDTWRSAWEKCGYADKRYAAEDIYEVLINAIDESYSAQNLWGNLPMYNTTADHYFADSGFLYRNIEFATLMLKEGRARQDAEMVENAYTVIRNQIDNDRIDKNITAYASDNSVYDRVKYEGLGGVVELYCYESSCAEGDKALCTKLLNYIVDKAEANKEETSLMALNFYMPLWKHQSEMFLDYSEVAYRLLNKAYEDTKDFKGYYGGIESTNTRLSVAEDYMILLRAFLDAYDTDGDEKWLNKSKELADYLETYQMIQPFELNPIGTTGDDVYYSAFIGNERFLGYGYIFNNTNHCILDCANASSVIELYRLYEITKDEHYLEFAEAKLFNTFLYVDMGDKVGYMDDPIHSMGLGFINEFVGNSTAVKNFAEGGVRGAAHDSIIGWNMWQIVTIFDWFNEHCGSILPDEIDAGLSHDLAVNRYVTGEGADPSSAPYKMVDGNEGTAWVPAGDKTAVVDLNEMSTVEKIELSSSASGSVKVSFSRDGVAFTENKEIAIEGGKGTSELKVSARYVKIVSEIPVSTFSAVGVPVFYKTIGYEGTVDSSIGDGTPSDCLDPMNYSTFWNAGSSESEKVLVLDLGKDCAIFQTAIKPGTAADPRLIVDLGYRIEISSDKTNWTTYAEHAAGEAFVFVDSGYAEARYVRLTIVSCSASRVNIADFKVMGQALSDL